jgi:hypothetical protein
VTDGFHGFGSAERGNDLRVLHLVGTPAFIRVLLLLPLGLLPSPFPPIHLIMAAHSMYGVPPMSQTDSDSYSGSGGSYASDSDAMSVRTTSSRHTGSGMELDSARGCSPEPSIYSYHPSIDGNAVCCSVWVCYALCLTVCALLSQLREVHGRYFNSQNEVRLFLTSPLGKH